MFKPAQNGKFEFEVRITPKLTSWIRLWAVSEEAARRQAFESGWTVHEIKRALVKVTP